MMRPIPVTQKEAIPLALRFVNNNLRKVAPDCYCEYAKGVEITSQDNHIFTFHYHLLLREDWTHHNCHRDEDGLLVIDFNPVHSSTYKAQKWSVTLLIPYGVKELLEELHYVDHDLLEEQQLPPLPRKS